MNWEQGRFLVTSPKTKRYHKGVRVVPLFPELQTILADAFDAAPGVAEFVIEQYRDANSNLRTQFERIIKRAAVKPWPRLFHNLRASRQTELENHFPSHVVCAWLGNSESIAAKHYLQVTEDHFSQASTCGPKRGQNQTETVGINNHPCPPLGPHPSGNIGNSLFSSVSEMQPVPPQGLEQGAFSSGIGDFIEQGEAPGRSSVCNSDPDLDAVIAAWPLLCADVKSRLLRLIRGTD